jgi:hypothetical protein
VLIVGYRKISWDSFCNHCSRRFFKTPASLYETKSVPFIIYSKNLLGNLHLEAPTAGGHIDIAPTLLELIAPEGFPYYSLGTSIFDRTRNQAGWGAYCAITPNYIFSANDLSNPELLPKEYLLDPSFDNLDLASKQYNAIHGLSWWRIMNGPNF